MVQHLRQAEIEFPTGSLYTIQTLDTERPLGIKSPQDQSHLTYLAGMGWDGMGGTMAHCCITAYSKDCSLASNLQAQQ